MFITDSTGGHILGIVASRTPNTSSYAGELYWLSFKSSGSFLGATLITPTESGRGNIEPSVISDGRDWSVSLTYWYVAFRNVDASTGVGDSAVTSYSSNWGHGWNPPRKIRSFDDYDLSINYNYESDSIYVLLTNSLTPSNPNLRLMRIYLGNLGTGTSWTQFNPANTPDPETLPQLAVNREVNEMAITYTREESGLKRIYYNYYTPGGAYWSNSAPVFVQPEAQNVSTLDCNIGQWAYRLCFRVIGGNDTIVYMNSGNISTGFAGRTQVSNHKPTGTVAPVIAGYTVPSNGGAVVYAGFGATPIYYDNSSIATNITSNGEIAPESFKLSQNYPNPFNPTTNIKFDIINKGNVKLVVFDATGREVTTLVNDNLDPGSYEVNFDASKLSSGVYFYKLTSGEFSDLKKMVLVK